MRRKNRWFLTAGLLAAGFVYALWPQPVRPTILYAYSDNAFGMWGLTLFKDGRFTITLPASYEEGLFSLSPDTVWLHYNKPDANLPTAYLINRDRKKIEELSKTGNKWSIANRGNWAELQYDSTRFYAH
jgi:hypothetical protein